MRSISASKFSVEFPPLPSRGAAMLALTEFLGEPHARTCQEDSQTLPQSGLQRSAVQSSGISADSLPPDRPERRSTSKTCDRQAPSISKILLGAYSDHRALQRDAHGPSPPVLAA